MKKMNVSQLSIIGPSFTSIDLWHLDVDFEIKVSRGRYFFGKRVTLTISNCSYIGVTTPRIFKGKVSSSGDKLAFVIRVDKDSFSMREEGCTLIKLYTNIPTPRNYMNLPRNYIIL